MFKKKLYRKVQGGPKSQATANPDTKWKRRMTEINEQLHKEHKISSLASLSEVITILNKGTKRQARLNMKCPIMKPLDRSVAETTGGGGGD